jgi:hypothetical protein
MGIWHAILAVTLLRLPRPQPGLPLGGVLLAVLPLRRLSDWRGRRLAVTFTYTRCPVPDFCPRLNRRFAAVQSDILADPRLRERVPLLSITFDPDFDTPAVLADHLLASVRQA